MTTTTMLFILSLDHVLSFLGTGYPYGESPSPYNLITSAKSAAPASKAAPYATRHAFANATRHCHTSTLGFSHGQYLRNPACRPRRRVCRMPWRNSSLGVVSCTVPAEKREVPMPRLERTPRGFLAMGISYLRSIFRAR